MEMTSGKRAALIVGIFFVCAVPVAASGAVTSAITELYAFFGDKYSTSVIQMILTVPQLCLIFVSPIFAWLCDYMKRRTLMGIAFVLYFIGGLGPLLTTSLPIILVFRFLLGLSTAILTPLGPILVDDFFKGKQRQRLMGYTIAFQMIGTTGIQILAGWLAVTNWQSVFWCYLIIVPAAIIGWICIPEPSKRTLSMSAEDTALAKKARIPKEVWLLVLAHVVFQVIFFTFVTNAGTIVTLENWGNAATFGVIVSVMTIGVMVGGFVWAWCYRVARKISMAIALFFCAIAFVFCWLASGLVAIFIGAALSGLGCGIFMAGLNDICSAVSPRVKVPMAMALVTASIGVGQNLSPWTFTPLREALNLELGRGSFELAAPLMAALAIVLLIIFIRHPGPKVLPSHSEGEETETPAVEESAS